MNTRICPKCGAISKNESNVCKSCSFIFESCTTKNNDTNINSEQSIDERMLLKNIYDVIFGKYFITPDNFVVIEIETFKKMIIDINDLLPNGLIFKETEKRYYIEIKEINFKTRGSKELAVYRNFVVWIYKVFRRNNIC